ncbi:hypothetical protein II906_13435, partial [bacterium]|nr:hypothetical protein [bacterium]
FHIFNNLRNLFKKKFFTYLRDRYEDFYMDISKARVNYLNKQAKKLFDSKEGKGLREECTEALKQWDYNGDGATSALELYKNTTSIHDSIFPANSEYAKKAEDIAQKQFELYSKFQGNDGVLSAEEYWAALQSDENNELLEEYWALSDNYETEQWMDSTASGKEEKTNCEEALKQWDYDGDGKTSVDEINKNTVDIYNHVFKGDSEKTAKAQEIAKQQKDVYAKYAGDDGVLSASEYWTALQSEENGKLLDQYWDMRNEMAKDTAPKTKSSSIDSKLSTIFKKVFNSIKNTIKSFFK